MRASVLHAPLLLALSVAAWTLAWPAWRATLDAWSGPFGPGWVLLASLATFQSALGALHGAFRPPAPRGTGPPRA